jgi:hypothetical protein
MGENRGRPKETPTKVKQKWVEEHHEFPSKPELGGTSKWYYDINKSQTGPWKVEHTSPKGFRSPKIKADKGKAYNNQPVIMVFKTSNRSNAKTKIKVWQNENIDYILSANKLPGIPIKAEILEVGVGKSFVGKYKKQYKIK